jgi:hypothetical protein
MRIRQTFNINLVARFRTTVDASYIGSKIFVWAGQKNIRYREFRYINLALIQIIHVKFWEASSFFGESSISHASITSVKYTMRNLNYKIPTNTLTVRVLKLI